MQCHDTRYDYDLIVTVQFSHYANGQTAIVLLTPENEPWLVATVAVRAAIPTDCVALKHWSENDGVPGMLADGGVIERKPVRQIQDWQRAIPVYRLTRAALAERRS
jgi:hypothetical protein